MKEILLKAIMTFQIAMILVALSSELTDIF